MSDPLVYIDRSQIHPGSVTQLRHAIAQLVAFVRDRQPQLITYSFHIDEEAMEMSVVAVHPDSASLENHLRTGGPEFRKVGQYITLRSIDVFGEPAADAVRLLHEKAQMLGDASVAVHQRTAGFAQAAPG
jgi:quinol monooxygenase YgiN